MICCRLIVLFTFMFLSASFQQASGQDLTGIWRGYFISSSGEQYKLEFQIAQNKSTSVTGVSYSYLDTRFYGKATMTGVFSIQNKIFSIQELKTTEVMNVAGNGTCLMNYKLNYTTSGKEQFLEGSFLGKREDRTDPKKNGTWGDCGDGRVYLRKVTTSEFYVEPFLRKETTKTNLPANKSTTAKPPVKKPAAPVTRSKTTNKPVAKTSPVKSQDNKSTANLPQKKTSVQLERSNDATSSVPRKITAKEPVIPIYTRSRKNETVKILPVKSREIIVKLYDNGEVDNDTISVYLDEKQIVASKRLTAAPITFTFQMDEESAGHTLVMVAENLGRIPPNTSLMIVYDGDTRHEVSITSTEQKNAMVHFRRKYD